ncbi:eCIS core domain-containing protein [Nocardia sp. bgisy118]|uniref:eCIS core domain-containing protein n=1 Tax=Nocardia sp. bgisy118 TaxID=3413786 RepID=UPI003F4A7699
MLTKHEMRSRAAGIATVGEVFESTATNADRVVIQRSLGNDYLQRVECQGPDPNVESQGGCGSHSCGGCARNRLVQAKATVGPAVDRYEREADLVADQVTGTVGPVEGPGVAPGLRGIQIHCLAEGFASQRNTAADVEVPTGSGRPLTAATRTFMEPRLGYDFGEVRVHQDEAAHRSSVQIGARAFTHQNHIYLRRGEHEHDRRLIAHELTHVIQQRGGAFAGSSLTSRPVSGPVLTATVQRSISPELEPVEEHLSYGLIDWWITDREAVRALELLQTLPWFQIAAFFTNSKFADRLRDNLPDSRVPEFDALVADVRGLVPPTATVPAVESRLSYGLFDWAITDKDAVQSLNLLKTLSGNQLAAALAVIDYGRLHENLPDPRKAELKALYTTVFGVGGTRATALAEYSGTRVTSLAFRSDQNVLRDNDRDWGNGGSLYGEPEWFIRRGGVVSHPMSQRRDTELRVDVRLDVAPIGAPVAPIRLLGVSGEPALNFDFTGTLSGGLGQLVTIDSVGKLPDTVTALRNKEIVWHMQWRDSKYEIGRTRHTIFVTAGEPRKPGQVTHKRMRTAVELVGAVVGRLGSLNPHRVVRELMRRWGAYDLRYQHENEWELADHLDRGAQCIDIVRFVMALLETVGLEGDARAVLVWAHPDSAEVARETAPSQGGLYYLGAHPMHGHWFAALMDANGCPNNYEAALKFEHGGRSLYYPGGVSMDEIYATKEEVLHVFQCLAWISPIGEDHFNIEEIRKVYPGGSCRAGEIRCTH